MLSPPDSSGASAPALWRLRDFVIATTRLVEQPGDDEAALLAALSPLLATLIAVDDWLPPDYAAPDPARYRQLLLHADPLERFSVVSFVWGVGQATPVHDHGVWGLVGVLRGGEVSTPYAADPNGRLYAGKSRRLEAGEITAVSPALGDLHKVANAVAETTVSIHIYGGNVGAIRRRVFDPDTGAVRSFVSGYGNATLPNLWDRSREIALGS